MVEYIGVAGGYSSDTGSGWSAHDVQEWAPYMGGAMLLGFLALVFVVKR